MKNLFIIAVLLCGCQVEPRGRVAQQEPPQNPYLIDNPYLADEPTDEPESEPPHAEPHSGPIDPEPPATVIRQRADEPHEHPHVPEPPAPENQSAADQPRSDIWDDDDNGWEPEPVEPEPEADGSPLAEALAAYFEQPRTWADVPDGERFRVTQPTIFILSATWCTPCQQAKQTAESLSDYVTLGRAPSDQIQIYDIETPEGEAVNRGLGEHIYGGTQSLTERYSGIPKVVVLYPDRKARVFTGWNVGVSEHGRRWLLQMLVHDGRRMNRAAARISFPSLIAFFYGPEGRREIANGLFLTCPVDMRMEFDPKAKFPRLYFPGGGPGLEFKRWPIHVRRELASISCSWDLSSVNVYLKGEAKPILFEIDQGSPSYSPEFSTN